MKTNPIGVRFRVDILEKLKTEHSAETPQKALNFLERFYVTHNSLAKDLAAPLRLNQAPVTIPIKPPPKNSIENATIELHNRSIWEKIGVIGAERCPKERDTTLGRKSWEMDKQRRIQELKTQLK